MQGPPEMGNHGAQPLAVQDPAGKIAKFLLHAAELASQSRSTRSRRAFTAKIGLVMGDNVVELAECTFALDRQAEVGLRRSGTDRHQPRQPLTGR